jgi:hypothetical protein
MANLSNKFYLDLPQNKFRFPISHKLSLERFNNGKNINSYQFLIYLIAEGLLNFDENYILFNAFRVSSVIFWPIANRLIPDIQ